MFHRLVKFCAVGGFVFGVDFGAIWVFKRLLPPLGAVALAYFIGVAVHFSLNKWWVFGANTRFCPREMARYVMTVAACWSCTMLVVALSLRFATSNVFVAKAMAIPPATILGFVLMRWFVFRQETR